MPRPHRAEVSVVKSGELRLSQALGNGQYGAVDKADFQVRVSSKQINCALVVAGRQVLDPEGSSAHLIEDCDEGLLSSEAAEEVIDLHEDGEGMTRRSCVPSIRAAQALWALSLRSNAPTRTPVSKISEMAAARMRRDWPTRSGRRVLTRTCRCK